MHYIKWHQIVKECDTIHYLRRRLTPCHNAARSKISGDQNFICPIPSYQPIQGEASILIICSVLCTPCWRGEDEVGWQKDNVCVSGLSTCTGGGEQGVIGKGQSLKLDAGGKGNKRVERYLKKCWLPSNSRHWNLN